MLASSEDRRFSRRRGHGRRLVDDRGGAVVVEYTMLLVFVAIPLVAALMAGGVMMLREYRMARDLVLLPVP